MRTVTIEKDGNNYKVNPNASGGGDATAYAWDTNNGNMIWTNFDVAPETVTDEMALNLYNDDMSIKELLYDPVGYGIEYTKISDTNFSLGNEAETINFTRDSTKDFTLWQLS